MNIRAHVMLAIVAALLLGAAWLVQEYHLWSEVGNYTLPWFCTAVAIAALIVLLVCSLRSEAPSDLPWPVAGGTVFAVAVILAVGTSIDHEKYHLEGIVGTRWELAGFVALLLGMFLLVRRNRPSS